MPEAVRIGKSDPPSGYPVPNPKKANCGSKKKYYIEVGALVPSVFMKLVSHVSTSPI